MGTMGVPLMKLVSAIGIRAGISELKLSLEDLSNNKFLKDMAELKAANSQLQGITKDIQEDISEQGQGSGLMAKPMPAEEEQSQLEGEI